MKKARRLSQARKGPTDRADRKPRRSLEAPPLLTEVPASYGVSRLVLLDIDPHWVFAYWEITGERIAAAWRRLGRRGGPFSKTVLRVYDVTGVDPKPAKARYSFDIEIVSGADNWYINLWSPQRSLYADLGLRGPHGQFVRIASSNRVETPPAQASAGWEERLATVGRRYRGPLTVGTARRVEPERGDVLDKGERRRPSEAGKEAGPGQQPSPAPAILAHYQASNISVIVPLNQGVDPGASGHAPQATLAALLSNQNQPGMVRHAGSDAVARARQTAGRAEPFIGSTMLVLEAVVAVSAPRSK